MPASSKGCVSGWSISSDSAKTGSSQWVRVESPNGRPRAIPMSADGMARRTSGRVIVQVDSWILSQIRFA